jgi:L-ascorbate metabolism protein UlaG (beta-lactamase superfamily)
LCTGYHSPVTAPAHARRCWTALLFWPMALAAAALPSSSHHGPDGFHNNYPHPGPQSFLRWKWEQLRDGLPAPPPPGGWSIPAMRTDVARLHEPARDLRLTWIGHATFLLQADGLSILTDPQFSERASPFSFYGPKRAVPLPVGIAELPRIDVVVISHNHYDHLDLPTVTALAASPAGSPLFLVPLGLKAWFAENGIERVEEYDWWEHRDVPGARFTLVPVQHWSQRTLRDRNRTLWGGWALEVGGVRVIHTGDLGLSPDTRDVGARLGPFDLALIPIGSYEPRWFMQTMHVNVPEAMQVRGDLRAERAIGMHWGTFEGLTDEPLDEPPRMLARLRAEQGLPQEAFDVMKIGETRAIGGARRAALTRR